MLSKKAEQFLTDLHLYLTTYGKNEQEIKDIVEELRDHLIEAEQRGKNIDDITGGSPKSYMKQVKNEMQTDKKEILSLLMLFFPLSIAYIILPDAVQGEAAYTLLEMIGYLSIFAIGLILFIVIARLDSLKVLSSSAQMVLYGIGGGLPLVLFIAIKLLNKWLELTPVWTATPLQNNLIIIVCSLYFIVCSIMMKTWSTIVVPLLIIVPTPIASYFTDSEKSQAIISASILMGGSLLISLYLFFQMKRDMKETQ
ncbi:HAAS domain-containing protein [Priestia koreensis]|uniref:HAAS transmembrane region domain-containing protein n=1 Tax=Priestia koreensis TaxID=284581 RepID=A0A0M0KZK7_9BACI|nr:DUF1129 family protein [Priestia koreensis]KOO44244.1 hypothetical protein AMD01_13205 [Priestia koreensis]